MGAAHTYIAKPWRDVLELTNVIVRVTLRIDAQSEDVRRSATTAMSAKPSCARGMSQRAGGPACVFGRCFLWPLYPMSAAVAADLPRLEEHLETYFGGMSLVYHHDVTPSDTVDADILIVAPSPEFDHYLLLTAGLSALPMSLPADVPERFEREHAELCMVLPNTWRLDEASLRDRRWSWPFLLLRLWARRPHLERGNSVGEWHTLGNGEPAEPYAPGASLVGAVLAPAVFLGPRFQGFKTVAGEPPIAILQVIPTTSDELAYARTHGARALVRALAATQTPPLGLADPCRPSLV